MNQSHIINLFLIVLKLIVNYNNWLTVITNNYNNSPL